MESRVPQGIKSAGRLHIRTDRTSATRCNGHDLLARKPHLHLLECYHTISTVAIERCAWNCMLETSQYSDKIEWETKFSCPRCARRIPRSAPDRRVVGYVEDPMAFHDPDEITREELREMARGEQGSKKLKKKRGRKPKIGSSDQLLNRIISPELPQVDPEKVENKEDKGGHKSNQPDEASSDKSKYLSIDRGLNPTKGPESGAISSEKIAEAMQAENGSRDAKEESEVEPEPDAADRSQQQSSEEAELPGPLYSSQQVNEDKSMQSEEDIRKDSHTAEGQPSNTAADCAFDDPETDEDEDIIVHTSGSKTSRRVRWSMIEGDKDEDEDAELSPTTPSTRREQSVGIDVNDNGAMRRVALGLRVRK